MKDKLVKVKRRRVDWKKAMDHLGDTRVSARFWALRTKHPSMSVNRCAYNALRNYYSTTAMLRYRYTGDFGE